jgi:signal transduction histidine kinase
MFRRLRIKLTALYLSAAIALVALLGGGIYHVLQSYFQMTTDLALKHKMMHEFQLLGAPLPASLANTDVDRSTARFGSPQPVSPDWGGEERVMLDTLEEQIVAYNSEFAAIFVMSLSADGRLLYNPSAFDLPIEPHQEAVKAAMATGNDWRTITAANLPSTAATDGSPITNTTRVRLLTYRLTRDDGPAVLQMGRVLDDQEAVLQQLLTYLVLLGGGSIIVMGFGSWWLAGRSLEPAETAWERQKAFIANASHELRAPLTLLRASAEVAQRSLMPNDDDIAELLGDVLQECDHMNRLVEDLLLLSRLDAGKLSVKPNITPLKPFLHDIYRQMGRLADEKQIFFDLQLPPNEDINPCFDPSIIRQVLIILLSNAFEHTPPSGRVSLAAALQNQTLEFRITDTGTGIEPEHLSHIFERFYRPDSTPSSERRGAGLGLSIAKGLIEAHNGQITAESTPGIGTQMSVFLALTYQ